MTKTNRGLVEYARAQLGRPYWYGTFGQIGSEKLLNDKAKQYKNQFSNARLQRARDRGDFGKKVHDCLGLWKGYMMSESPEAEAVYNSKYDYSADSIFKAATEKGTIDTIPNIEGLGLYKKGHFGVYLGNGREIEARGFDYGVLEDAVSNTAFTHWFKVPHIEYGEATTPAPAPEAQNSPKKSEDEIVSEVIAGVWGNGSQRKKRLTEAGYNYDSIQSAVNARLKGTAKAPEAPKSDSWTGLVTTQSSPLRVRQSPSLNSPVVRLVAKGTKLQLTGGVVSGFYKLSDGSGYVSANYIRRI